MDELKKVVFSMNPNSADVSHCMNGYFFKKCRHIIKKDLMGVVQEFFTGHMIHKYFSHFCIVLLPDVNNPNTIPEYRPINTTKFTSNIISKLMRNTLRPILPDLICPNQFGFVKGRIISEKIKNPNIGSNVIIKLDMT